MVRTASQRFNLGRLGIDDLRQLLVQFGDEVVVGRAIVLLLVAILAVVTLLLLLIDEATVAFLHAGAVWHLLLLLHLLLLDLDLSVGRHDRVAARVQAIGRHATVGV